MTTITIDDALATRLRTLRGEEDLDAVAAEAIARTVYLWEREAQGRAELQAMLDGPRHTFAEGTAKLQQKYGFPDLSHLSAEELADRAEATLATLPPEKVAEESRGSTSAGSGVSDAA